MIETYRAYTEAELQNPAHAVTPEMLLAIVGREDVEKDVRRKAAETIVLAPVVTNDPSFAMDGRGVARARARFSSKVLTLLLDADPFVRGLAKSILEGLWGGWGSRIKDIRNCDPRDLDSCYKASKAWEEVFRS